MNEKALRERLAAVLKDPTPTSSLYLRVIGCIYLAATVGAEEAALESLFQFRTGIEQVDHDELLTQLIMLSDEKEGN